MLPDYLLTCTAEYTCIPLMDKAITSGGVQLLFLLSFILLFLVLLFLLYLLLEAAKVTPHTSHLTPHTSQHRETTKQSDAQYQPATLTLPLQIPLVAQRLSHG